jgi:hypothetical protein
MDNNEKLLQHKLKCKLCQNKIQNYDVQLYTGQSEFIIYAQIKSKHDITFEILKEHKLFIPQLYKQKELLDKIRDYDFSINSQNNINESKLSKDTSYMQKIFENILWEEIPVLVDRIISKSKGDNISLTKLITILDKLIACSKKIDSEDNIVVGGIEQRNEESGKQDQGNGLTEKSILKTINALEQANELLKDYDND